MQEFLRNLLIYVLFYECCAFFCEYAIFRKLCDRMRFEVDFAKSHHRIISQGLHMIKNHTYWDASCTVGPSRKRNSYQPTLTCLCFGSPTVQQ